MEEAQGLLKLCDQLKVERDDLKSQIGLKPAALGPDGKGFFLCDLANQKVVLTLILHIYLGLYLTGNLIFPV